MYNGSSWSTTDVDGIEELQSTSCTSTTFCAVIDLVGHAGFYSQLGTQQLIWDASASEPLVLSDGTNYYVYGATGEPVEQVNVTASPPSNNPVFLTYTPSDSSWLATNTSGDELAFWRYDAFGTLALGIPDSPFGYGGQYVDRTSIVPSDFGNMRARWYQAQTGQFTSVDPDFAQTDQAYDYADDDPVNEADPSGDLFMPTGPDGGSTQGPFDTTLNSHIAPMYLQWIETTESLCPRTEVASCGVGYGHRDIQNGWIITITTGAHMIPLSEYTKSDAVPLLITDLDDMAATVLRYVSGTTSLNQNQFSAVLDLAYNGGLGSVGPGTQRVIRDANSHQQVTFIEAFDAFRNSNDCLGDLGRRLGEAAIFVQRKGAYTTTPYQWEMQYPDLVSGAPLCQS